MKVRKTKDIRFLECMMKAYSDITQDIMVGIGNSSQGGYVWLH